MSASPFEVWVSALHYCFLVALPLCLGIAIATGYPPAAGLASGIIGGIIVGFLAGCPLQVSGPAAGLITIVWEAAHQFGYETVGVIVLLAGLMQVSMGVLGLGMWFRAVSPAVIQGMLAGIGVLIFSSQFHVMVDDTPRSGGLANLLSIPESVMKGLIPLDGTAHHLAASVGVVTILAIVAWNLMPQKVKVIPAPLVAVVIATIIAAVWNFPIKYVDVPENFFDSFRLIDLSLLPQLANAQVFITALTIGFIASAETLLTATAVDQMTPKFRTNYNKEIIAQGIGNSLAGIFGLLPITGVIVRSSANVQAGAESRNAAILHGIWILVFILVIPFALQLIPVAALAAILVYTGYKLVNVKAAKKLVAFGKSELMIYGATIAGIVLTNLLEGVLIGVGLALMKQFYTNSRLTINQAEVPDEDMIHMSLKGTASFITLPKLADKFEKLASRKQVFIHIDELSSIDHACIEFLQNWEKQYTQHGGAVTLQWDGVMNKYQSFSSIPKKLLVV